MVCERAPPGLPDKKLVPRLIRPLPVINPKAIRASNQASTTALAEVASARFREIETDVGDLKTSTGETKNEV